MSAGRGAANPGGGAAGCGEPPVLLREVGHGPGNLAVRCSYSLDHLSHDTSHTFTIRPQGRLYYSLAVAGVQFLLPSSVLALVHASIYHKLTQVAIYLSAFVSPLVMWCGIV